MPLSAPQQDRTTQFPLLHFRSAPSVGLVLIYSFHQFGGPLSGCSVLIHSPQRSGKSQCGTRAQLRSSLFALSPAWEHEFLFPSVTFQTANSVLILFLGWSVTTRLTKFHKTKNRKLPSDGLLLDKLRTQDFAGPLSSRRSLCNGLCTARRFHTCENDHTCRIWMPR